MAELSRQAQKRLRMTALAYAKTNAGYGTNIRIDQAKAMNDLHEAAREFAEKTDKEWAAEVAEAKDRCATLEAANEKALEAFAAQEWAMKADWLGICPFRRLLGCEGRDGHTAPVGPPKPKEHAAHCPYFGLRAALEALRSARSGSNG